jgi:hypothetical protein
VTFDNRAARPVGPFVLRDARPGIEVTSPGIPPGAKETVRLAGSGPADESCMWFEDSVGRRYYLVEYYERTLTGIVEVQVSSVATSGVLQGRKRALISYPASDEEWRPLLRAAP